MALPFQGRGSSVGIGNESTPGTGVAVTNFRPPVRLTGGAMTRKVPRKNLRTVSGVSVQLAHYIADEMPSGSFEIECTYENVGMFLHMAMGGSSSSGGGPYTHTYALSDLDTCTLELVRGTATNSEVFNGTQFGKTTWRAAAGDALMMAVDWIAMTASARTTPTSVSYGTGDSIALARHSGQFTWNAVSYDLTDMEISVDHQLQRRPYLGSLTSKEAASGGVVVRVRVTVEYTADTLYTAFRATTTADGSIVFTNSSQSLTFNLFNAYVDKAEEPVEGHGVIRQRVEFVCQGDTGGDKPLSVVLVNGNSSATAN